MSTRVRLGGHKVSEEAIAFNFINGFKNLYDYFDQFTSVTAFDNSIISDNELRIPEGVLYIVDYRLYLLSEKPPQWAKPIIDRFDGYLYVE